MSSEESNASELAVLSPTDAWVFAKALSGQAIHEEFWRVSKPHRQFAKSISETPVEDRSWVWETQLVSLSQADSNAWTEAVDSVGPDDPPPDDGWEQPVSFVPPAVDAFPLEVYPSAVQILARTVARSVGCAMDFAALTILAVAGAAIGRSASLRLKDGYFAFAGIYAICVGRPGDGKSPAVGMVAGPMTKIDEEQCGKWKTAKDVYDAENAKYELEVKSTRRSRPKPDEPKDPEDFDDSVDQREVVDTSEAAIPLRPTPPVLTRGVVGDITIEAMDAIMAANPRGIIQVLDEASTLTASMNQYRGGKGSDRQWFMSTWSGQPRTVDRKGHADNVPIRVSQPFLCLVGGMVPDMIGSLCDEKGRYDGLIDRILFAYPDPIPKVGWSDEGVPDDVSAEWAAIVVRLRARPLKWEEMRATPDIFQFSSDGKLAWVELINAHFAEQRSSDFVQSLAGPWAKFEQYAGRITLILHLLDHASDPSRDQAALPDVTAETVRKAFQLLAYFKSHIRRVHEAMKAKARGEEGSDDVQTILKWILLHKPESFSHRDLTRDLTRTFSKRARAMAEALEWLVKRNCIRLQAELPVTGKKPRGRTKSRAYLVNPGLYDSQNCQNPVANPRRASAADHTSDSGDSATDDAAA